MYRSSQALARQTFHLSRLLLLFPLSLKQDVFKLDLLAAAGVLLSKLLLATHVLRPHQDLASSVSAVVAYCAVFLHSLAFFCKRKTLRRLFRILSACDIQIGDRPPQTDWLLMILYSSSALLIHPSIYTVFKVWLALNLFGALHPFVYLVRTLQRWFASLHQRPFPTAENLRSLCILHQRYTEACRVLNTTFSYQLLWSICALFVHLVLTSYGVFKVVQGAAGVLEVIDKVIGFSYYIYVCSIVTSACVKTSKEVPILRKTIPYNRKQHG